MKAPLPPNELQRLETLRSYNVLDTPPESAFDDLTQLAAQICEVPIAAVSLVDGNRQWFKSIVGLSATETSRDIAFCAHTILNPDELLEVRDAQLDSRFADNPLVTGNPNIRFYAGAPLVAPDGLALGTLCVIDHEPHVLSAKQKTALSALSRAVIAQLELRRVIATQRLTEGLLQSLNASLGQKIEARTAELTREIEERKQVETALKKSEQRWKFALEGANQGVWDWNMQTNEVIFSKRWKTMLGFDENEIENKFDEWEKRVHPQDLPRILAEIHAYLDGKSPTFSSEQRLRHKDGSWRWILSRGMVVSHDEIGKPCRLIGTHADITDRKEAEARQVRAVVDASPVATMLTDTNGVIIYANTVTEGVFGSSLNELSGKNINALIPAMIQLDRMRSPKARHTSAVQELTAIHKNGREIPVEVTLSPLQMGKQTAVIISVNDISERKAAEISLRESEQFNRTILNTAIDGFFIVDANCRFLNVNPAYCRMLGYTREEILDMSLRDIEANETPEQMAQHIERIIAAGSDFFETRHRGKNGTLVGVETSVNHLAVSDKFFCFIRDISERKQAEQQRLLGVERQRDNLVREVHHRIKNSLQGMIGLLDLQANEHPELAPLIEDINSRIMSLAIVFGLLGKREQNHVQLCEVTSEICKFASQVANVIIDPTVEVKQTQSVLLDKDMAVPIALIVNELITNALKHGKTEDGWHKIGVSIDIEGHSAILKVRNKCTAMPPALNFEFGTGLGTGLTLVHSMLPSKGAKLTLIFDNNTMTARLLLTSPTVTILTQ